MKKLKLLLITLLAGSLCASFASCATPPPDGGELTQAELSVVYENAANSAYTKSGIDNPHAPTAASFENLPDETHLVETPAEIKQVKLNVCGMPAVLQLVSDLYANENFVMTDKVVNFSAQVELPNGPNSTAFYDQAYSMWTDVDVAEGKIYLEMSVTVMGNTQYNYAELDFNFSTNAITSFRYLVHMGFSGMYGDIVVDADGNMHINDPASPSTDFIAIADSMKGAFDARVAQGETLDSQFSTELQTYLDTVQVINAALQGA